MKSLLSKINSLVDTLAPGVPPEYGPFLRKQTTVTNYGRARLMVTLLLVLGLYLALTDLYYLETWRTKPAYRYFFRLDIVFISALGLFYFLLRITTPSRVEAVRLRHRMIIFFLGLFIMVWCGAATGVEWHVFGNTTTLVIGGFAIAAAAYLSGWEMGILLVAGLLAFYGTVHYLGDAPGPFFAHFISLISMVILAWGISRILFRTHLKGLIAEAALQKGRDELEAHVQERTRELSAVNRRLKDSEEKYRLLVENANDAIFIIQDDRLVFANRKTWQSVGYSPEELSRVPFTDLIHPEDRDWVLSAYYHRLNGAEPDTPYSFRIMTRNRGEIWGQVNSVPILWENRPATLNFIRDITLQKKLEVQFHEAQRMEAIGTLAGGVAHDVNNMLMGIQGYVSIMLYDLSEDHPHYRKLRNIEQTVQSGSEVTRQLLGFARGGKYEVKTTDLNRLIREKTGMFEATRKELTIVEEYAQSLRPVEVDRGQIEQVLLNLYINAWQAMPKGGTLTVRTENVALDDARASEMDVSPGAYVCLEVTDTGIGMDSATRRRIFEPFFTTKERGRGTGLGLASVYGIIRNHGGAVEVFSEVGAGSTFKVCLPAIGASIHEESSERDGPITGEGTILLVDDEETLLDIGSQMLARLGYIPLTAPGGRDAVELYLARREEIDLVILDMIMPGMGGGEAYDLLKSVDPNVRVLLSSGYSRDGQAEQLLTRGCDGFIQKPFTLSVLSRKICEILCN